MERLIVAAVLIVLAVVVAGVVQRRRSDAPTQATSALIPQQLDRADFSGRSAEWLIVLFTSETCEACDEVRIKAKTLAADDAYVQESVWQDEPDLHRRYSIETVPLMVIAGSDGAVEAGFVGVPPTAEMWAAMSALRDRHSADS